MVTRRDNHRCWSLLLVSSVLLGLRFMQTSHSLMSDEEKAGPKCSPVQSVGFAKTHKTASSSVQNILLRAGLAAGWNLALPAQGHVLLRPPGTKWNSQPFQTAWLEEVAWRRMVEQEGYSALLLHTIWNQREVEHLLGRGQDVKLITILRDPVDQFESMYDFFDFEAKLGMDLEQFVVEYVVRGKEMSRVNGFLGRNQQLWDLGLGDTQDLDLVASWVEQVDRDFNLVMIAEELEESLVLLSHVLCWSLVHLTSLRVNSRGNSQRTLLSTVAREHLRWWLEGDYKLYHHFTTKLQESKEQLGKRRLREGIEELRRENRNLVQECRVEEVADTRGLPSELRPGNTRVVGFNVTKQGAGCQLFAWNEAHFIDVVREKQIEKFLKWKEN